MNLFKNIVRKVIRYSQVFLRYVKKVVEYIKQLSDELGKFLVIVAGLITLLNIFMLELNDVIETVKNTIDLIFL